jgi:hypothetical protein
MANNLTRLIVAGISEPQDFPIWPNVVFSELSTEQETHYMGLSYCVKPSKGKLWLMPMREFESISPITVKDSRYLDNVKTVLISKLRTLHTLMCEKCEPSDRNRSLNGKSIDLLIEGIPT